MAEEKKEPWLNYLALELATEVGDVDEIYES
jgi:hypothetical protein